MYRCSDMALLIKQFSGGSSRDAFLDRLSASKALPVLENVMSRVISYHSRNMRCCEAYLTLPVY